MTSMSLDERVRLALLCDYALTSEDGKVSAIGLFSSMSFASLPANYPRFFLVIVASLQMGLHTGQIGLIGPAGIDVLPDGPAMELEVPEGSNETNLIIGFDNLAFESAGMYQLQIKFDGLVAAVLPFAVMSAAEPSMPAPRGNA